MDLSHLSARYAALVRRTAHMRFNVVVVVDGACQPNPGYMGWAAAIVSAQTLDSARWGEITYVSGWQLQGTNNTAELIAAIEGIRACPDGATPLLITDSKNTVRVLTSFQSQYSNPAHAELKQQFYSLVECKGIKFYRNNIVRVNGNHSKAGAELPLHSIVDGQASRQANYSLRAHST